MNILAIESSCDELSAALIDDNFFVLEHCIYSSASIAKETGGVIPEIAARAAGEKAQWVIDQVLQKRDPSQIDAIAVTVGPGLSGSLMVGIHIAKTLAYIFNKPLIPIHHIYGHLSANYLWKDGIEKPHLPNNRLILTVSGGHNDIVIWKNGKVKKIGYTLDDAAGECFDKCARMLNLPYPGGPHLSKLAEKGNSNAFKLPRPMMKSKNELFSFSGLKTALLYTLKDLGGIEKLTEDQKADLAASTQKAIVDTLIAKCKNAAKKYNITHIEITGGVSANTLLRSEFIQLATSQGYSYTIPQSFEFCTDNAAMIGAAAQYITQHFPEKKWKPEGITLSLSHEFPEFLSLSL